MIVLELQYIETGFNTPLLTNEASWWSQQTWLDADHSPPTLPRSLRAAMCSTTSAASAQKKKGNTQISQPTASRINQKRRSDTFITHFYRLNVCASMKILGEWLGNPIHVCVSSKQKKDKTWFHGCHCLFSLGVHQSFPWIRAHVAIATVVFCKCINFAERQRAHRYSKRPSAGQRHVFLLHICTLWDSSGVIKVGGRDVTVFALGR